MGVIRDLATCLDCGNRQTVRKREWIRASRPRCVACGGPVEPSVPARDDMARHNDAQVAVLRVRNPKLV